MNVIPMPLPWLEAAILVALAGSLLVRPFRDPLRAWRWGLLFAGLTLACALLACLGYYCCSRRGIEANWSMQAHCFGRQFLGIDELNAPLLPLVSLLYCLTILATGRTKMRRFSLSWSLASTALGLLQFGCIQPGVLVALLVAGTLPGYIELRNRQAPTTVYVLHMALYVGLLCLGWAFVDPNQAAADQPIWASLALLGAILIRCGTVPVHCWLTDWFEQASFGNALLFVIPLQGVYAALRLILPLAPDWVLQSLGLVSLLTAIYAAGMAVVQRDARRFFAYLFLSNASLVLVGLELHTDISLTGALSLWVSAALSLAGLGLTLRALEARFGRLTLGDYRGLYDHCPALAICFALTGLASVGFPGTLGFVAAELLVEGAVEANLVMGIGVILATAINGIAVVRTYLVLFTGTRHMSTVSLNIGVRERLAVLTLTALVVGGGLHPQLGIATRHRAAHQLLEQRQQRLGLPDASQEAASQPSGEHAQETIANDRHPEPPAPTNEQP